MGNTFLKIKRMAVENVQILRKNGHDAFVIVISQGQKHSVDYNVIEELFSVPLKAERNPYCVEHYEGLAEINSVL